MTPSNIDGKAKTIEPPRAQRTQRNLIKREKSRRSLFLCGAAWEAPTKNTPLSKIVWRGGSKG
jgi:hypothetical protein